MQIANILKTLDKPFYSLEFFPPKEKEKWENFFAMVEKLKVINPLFASVTCGAGGSVEENTVAIASEIKNRYNMETIAHCTCVRSDIETMNKYLDSLEEKGIKNILALRGDKPRNVKGEIDESLISHNFTYAQNLVEYVKEHRPQLCVGVAAYPAPHPESKTFAEDRKHLAQKIRSGADFAITQLFFDNREYYDLLDMLKKENLTCPIIPAILPIQSFASLKRIMSLCGANIPGKLYLEIEEVHEKSGIELVKEVGLKYAIAQVRQLLDAGAPGVHLYTLNQAELCLELVDRV